MAPELDTAVRAALRYDGIGNLTLLRRAAGLSGAQFSDLRRGRRSVSPVAARRLARVLRAWATQLQHRASRITRVLEAREPVAVAEEEGAPHA